MCQINLMHRVVQYRAEFHAYQEILPCTIPPCALNLLDTPNLFAYMQIRKCHFFYSESFDDFCSFVRPSVRHNPPVLNGKGRLRHNLFKRLKQ